ncbi:MAG: AI-2E family transporter [Xanthomonadales bacterium]|nr:AI-2E family transporter [Xanthomonadales bacterium]
MDLLKAWFRRTFSDPQVVILGVLLLLFFVVVFGLGAYLAPVFASLIIAYLLEAVVLRFQRIGMPRLPAVLLVFLFFLAALIFLLFVLVPMLTTQLSALVRQFPSYISQGKVLMEQLLARYPELLSATQIERITDNVGSELAGMGQQVVGWSLASVASALGLLIFLVLVPVLVFFFLKDKDGIIRWFVGYLPRERSLVTSVWIEVESQIANYVRGKAVEIVIVGAVTYVTFVALGLQYAALLATLVGFSVLIPYVGAAVVTLPIALVAFFQWGWGWDFGQVMIAYAIIQALDGNVLVPLLFSEAVNLHPVAIIVAILVFGGFWGFWGVFFAIPLATLVQAVLKAWPRKSDLEERDADSPSVTPES